MKLPTYGIKKIVTILALISSLITVSQNTLFIKTAQIDTIIITPAYTSYYSFKYLNPIAVTYTLYHGGGDCSRAKYSFHNDLTIKTATNKDYSHSGYDKGHMANAEDFAYNCTLDELTFRYYNCIPQTPELNRGLWKQYETLVRKYSQTDSLFIICYNTYPNASTLIGRLHVPDTCYKYVYSLTTNKLILSFKAANNHTPYSIPIDTLNISPYIMALKQ